MHLRWALFQTCDAGLQGHLALQFSLNSLCVAPAACVDSLYKKSPRKPVRLSERLPSGPEPGLAGPLLNHSFDFG